MPPSVSAASAIAGSPKRYGASSSRAENAAARVNIRHAALALGQLGTAEDAPRLVELLKRVKRSPWRRAIVYALGKLGNDATVKTFASMWGREKSQEMKSAMLLAAGRIGTSSALELIRDKGIKSRKETVRRAATLALADLGDPATFDLLKSRLKDSDDRVVAYALIGLASFAHPGVGKAIKRSRLHQSGKSELKALAITALGMQDDPTSLKLLLSRMKPPAKRDRLALQALAFALARRKSSEASAQLRRLFTDRDHNVSRAAMCASALRGQGTLIVLAEIPLSKKHADEIRESALVLLALRSHRVALQVVKKLLDEKDDKKKILELARDLRDLIETGGSSTQAILRGRVQVLIDDLGGSPQWNLILARHRIFLENEQIGGSLANRGQGTRPDGSNRPPDIWTKEEEDLRIWYDLFPYFDARKGLDLPSER